MGQPASTGYSPAATPASGGKGGGYSLPQPSAYSAPQQAAPPASNAKGGAQQPMQSQPSISQGNGKGGGQPVQQQQSPAANYTPGWDGANWNPNSGWSGNPGLNSRASGFWDASGNPTPGNPQYVAPTGPGQPQTLAPAVPAIMPTGNTPSQPTNPDWIAAMNPTGKSPYGP